MRTTAVERWREAQFSEDKSWSVDDCLIKKTLLILGLAVSFSTMPNHMQLFFFIVSDDNLATFPAVRCTGSYTTVMYFYLAELYKSLAHSLV